LSKDRDGIEDDERLPPEVDGEAADQPTDLDSAAADDADDQSDTDEAADADDVVTDDQDSDGDASDDLTVEVTDDLDADDTAVAELNSDDASDEKADAVSATTKSGVAGSNRAAARLASSRAAAATTAKKEAPTRARDTAERAGFFARMGRFIREVVAELRKVIWPSRKQWATFTLVVIVFLVIMVALVSGMDVLFQVVVSKVFG